MYLVRNLTKYEKRCIIFSSNIERTLKFELDIGLISIYIKGYNLGGIVVREAISRKTGEFQDVSILV